MLTMGENTFVTGAPGAGKSHLVRQYVHYAREKGLTVALTASTGIAATHIGGMTIHSWSGLGIRKHITRAQCKELASNATVRRRVCGANVLIIDEISMLDAATVDAVDLVCRVLRKEEAPFGGLQVVFVGDFFQLPPVSRAGEPLPQLAYRSAAWQEAGCTVCYLTEQHRQDDAAYVEVLSALRCNTLTGEHVALLHGRRKTSKATSITKLYSHNADVDRMNAVELAKIAGKSFTFTMTSFGNARLVEQLKKGCLSPEELVVKVGARVMFTRNNAAKGYVNGSIGEVLGVDPGEGWPVVRLEHGKEIVAEPEVWSYEGDGGGTALAMVRQVPLRLAWALTVHKSQGMSLDSAQMDLRGAFAYGQGYVALSRVRSLKGLFLEGLNDRALQVDPEVLATDAEFRHQSVQAVRRLKKLGAQEITARQQKFVVFRRLV